MHLVQFLLPVRDNDRRPFSKELFDRVRAEMTDRFGGVTAFLQSPAVGLWQTLGHVERDEMVLFEVMVETLNRSWWANYRGELAERFRQDSVVIRAIPFESL